MQALGVGPGDEVIVPDVTFVATATAAMYLGARPVFCDVSLDDYCIDACRIAALVTPRTRLIIPVHFGGRVAPMDAIRPVATSHGLKILEDAASAHLAGIGSRFAGTFGDAAIFSFTPTKLMTTGEGGMITTSDAELADRCRQIRNFGDAGKFDWELLGFNFRMTAVSAAIGIKQLKRLPEFVAQRREIAQRYDEAFRGTDFLVRPPMVEPEGVATNRTDVEVRPTACNFQLYPVLLDVDRLGISRDDFIVQLAQRGVASRLYYPPLHRMGVFARFSPASDEHFPAATELARRSMCLPIFAGMTRQQQQHVIDNVLEVADSQQSNHAEIVHASR
jgi:perosamine synthetase